MPTKIELFLRTLNLIFKAQYKQEGKDFIWDVPENPLNLDDDNILTRLQSIADRQQVGCAIQVYDSATCLGGKEYVVSLQKLQEGATM